MEIENIETRSQLVDFARRHRLREDWHEPDEQDVDAYPAIGTSFDNACCNPKDFYVRYARRQDKGGIYDTVYSVHTTSYPTSPDRSSAEHGVFLFHRGEPVAFVNLALLLAMACGFEGFR